MGEYVGKPEFSINVPFGAEEGHANLPYKLNFFQIASCPSFRRTIFLMVKSPSITVTEWPAILAAYLRYAFQLKMSTRLIDRGNRRERRILPWNAGNLRFSFRNMGEMFEYIAKDSTNKEIQEVVFGKMYMTSLFQTLWRKMISPLSSKKSVEMDIQGIIKSFKKQENLDKLEKIPWKYWK